MVNFFSKKKSEFSLSLENRIILSMSNDTEETLNSIKCTLENRQVDFYRDRSSRV